MTKGDRLRALRESVGLTLEEVAERLSITRQAVYKYEKNIVTNIPSDRIEALAKLYNSSPEYIMGWDANPEETSKKIDATVDVIARMEKDATFSGLVFKLNELEPEKLKRIAAIIDASIAAL